jgi:hypothetical protein
MTQALNRVEDTLTFTTGAGVLTEQPQPPDAVLTHFELANDLSSRCGPLKTGTCVSVADDNAWLDYAFIDEFDQRQPPESAHGSFYADLSGIEQGTNFKCVSIRTRALNATYSAPVELCGADAPLVKLSKLGDTARITCTNAGLGWSNATGNEGHARGTDSTLSSSSGGCAVARPAAPASGRALGRLGIGALLALGLLCRRGFEAARGRRRWRSARAACPREDS